MEVSYPSESLVALEIARQPLLWPTTVTRVLAANLSSGLAHRPIIFTGAGTSGYAGTAIAEAWPGAKAIPTTELLLQSAEDIQRAEPAFCAGGVLVSLARSGDSPESAAVVERMQRFFPGVRQLAILCNAQGRLAQIPGVEVICLDARTNDRSLAMTSSFSNLVLGGLALQHAAKIEESLPDISDRMAGQLSELNAAAVTIAQACTDRIVVLSSAMRALALEVSLKVLELTAGHVMGLTETFLGFRHGALCFLRENTPVICFASSDPVKRRYEREMLEDLKKSGLGKVALVGDEECRSWPHEWWVRASAPQLPDTLRTPFEIPFGQLLAYQLSVHAKVNPDNPSPEGLITRVVKRFSIHDEG